MGNIGLYRIIAIEPAIDTNGKVCLERCSKQTPEVDY